MVINGVEYGEKDLDFTNILCDLEDIGVDIIGMSEDVMKPFTLCRGIVSVYTQNKDLTECGKLLSEHLQNGGTLNDIMGPFTEAMNAAGFGNEAQTAERSVPAKTASKATKK